MLDIQIDQFNFPDVDNVEINSPFRYAGGKFYARKLIKEMLPKHDSYVEVFAGGGSVFFSKNKASNNWLNDIDKELINTLEIIQKKPIDLIKALDGIAATKELHSYYKNEFKPKNKLEKALKWFYLNRTSYSGIMKSQNCFFGYGDKYSMRPENWPRNILRTASKLRNVKLTSLDFEDVIKESPKGSFLFIDPPYFNADQDKFYTHSFKKEDHFRLAKILKKYRNKFTFMLTYDNSPEVRELYSWTDSHHEKEWNYTISRTDDQKNGTSVKGTRSKGKEIFILNYHPPESLQEVQQELSQQELLLELHQS